MMPNTDHPEAFGQHPNGDIASQIKETRLLFDTLLSLQPQVTSSSSKSNKKSVEEEVMELSSKVLESLPQKVDYESTCIYLSKVKDSIQRQQKPYNRKKRFNSFASDYNTNCNIATKSTANLNSLLIEAQAGKLTN